MQPVIIRLLNIDLPKFDGNYDTVSRFIQIPLTRRYPKFKNCIIYETLTDEAAKAITALEITNDKYKIAWRLLKQRYENKKLIIHLI